MTRTLHCKWEEAKSSEWQYDKCFFSSPTLLTLCLSFFFFTLFDKERLNGKAWDAPVRRWFHHEQEPGGSQCAVWVFKKSYFAVRLRCVQTCVYLTGMWGGDDDMCWGWRVGGGLAWGQRVMGTREASVGIILEVLHKGQKVIVWAKTPHTNKHVWHLYSCSFSLSVLRSLF